jgi:hypothetical protein
MDQVMLQCCLMSFDITNSALVVLSGFRLLMAVIVLTMEVLLIVVLLRDATISFGMSICMTTIFHPLACHVLDLLGQTAFCLR